MKKYLVIGLLCAAAGLASARAQSQSFSVPAGAREQRVQRRPPPPPVRRGPVGAFPRAARGNPVQMINPLAPRRYYGAPQDTVTTEPYDGRDKYTRSQVTGLILFGYAW